MRIILASGSPRRRELMDLMGLPYEVMVSDVDETMSGPPLEQVRELPLRKAYAVIEMLKKEGTQAQTLVIAADTIVYLDGQVLNKPADAKEATAMLRLLSGRRHTVYTGVAIINIENDQSYVFSSVTDVFFKALSEEMIHWYVASGDAFDKAGGYGIQGKGALLVDRIDGDFYTVMGFPIANVCEALQEMGVDVFGKKSV